MASAPLLQKKTLPGPGQLDDPLARAGPATRYSRDCELWMSTSACRVSVSRIAGCAWPRLLTATPPPRSRYFRPWSSHACRPLPRVSVRPRFDRRHDVLVVERLDLRARRSLRRGRRWRGGRFHGEGSFNRHPRIIGQIATGGQSGKMGRRLLRPQARRIGRRVWLERQFLGDRTLVSPVAGIIIAVTIAGRHPVAAAAGRISCNSRRPRPSVR